MVSQDREDNKGREDNKDRKVSAVLHAVRGQMVQAHIRATMAATEQKQVLTARW